MKCDHCGCEIDIGNDIDCCEMKMYEIKEITSNGISYKSKNNYYKADNGKLYYCGNCKSELLSSWIKNYKNKSFKNFKQIKSKARVKEFAEVFTAEREVKAMCDLIPSETWENIGSTFLEPACGNGNFLVEIVERKLKRCKNANEGLIALQSIYGIDIQRDNVEESKKRLFDMFVKTFPKEPALTGLNASLILESNIICGNSLEIMKEITGGDSE